MTLPDLAFVFQNYLSLLMFDNESFEYVNVGDINVPEINEIVYLHDAIIVTTKSSHSSIKSPDYLIKFNLQLEEIHRKFFTDIGSLATDGKTIFISAEGDFIALNRNLEILSRVELLVPFYSHGKKMLMIFW